MKKIRIFAYETKPNYKPWEQPVAARANHNGGPEKATTHPTLLYMEHEKRLSTELAEHTGVDTARCYQCGKCTAGCALAPDMDMAPSFLMRLLQTRTEENDRRVLGSTAIWLCLGCENCVARCPMEIDIPAAMDYLRERSRTEGLVAREARDIVAFHKSFLDMVRRNGRTYEIGLVAEYKLRTMHIMQDVDIAPAMLARGKLNIMPERLEDNASKVGRIFAGTIDKKDRT